MSGISNSFSAVMLIPAQSFALWVSLHNADPGPTGVNEQPISPYNRSPASWQPFPTGGKLVIGAPVHVPINAGYSVSHYGLWNQRTLGIFCAGASLSAIETFAATGTYTISSLNFAIPLAP
jgi:hypothetical protein